jgi:hypothetical protein
VVERKERVKAAAFEFALADDASSAALDCRMMKPRAKGGSNPKRVLRLLVRKNLRLGI